jgi:hypothetical protein
MMTAICGSTEFAELTGTDVIELNGYVPEANPPNVIVPLVLPSVKNHWLPCSSGNDAGTTPIQSFALPGNPE